VGAGLMQLLPQMLFLDRSLLGLSVEAGTQSLVVLELEALAHDSALSRNC
jgi:hypothetical protein